MKVAKRTGENCITIECPANEVHSKHGISRMFCNLDEAEELANDILDTVQNRPSQAGIDAEQGADEYRREREV